MARNGKLGWKWLDVAGNRWKSLEVDEIGWKYWKLLEWMDLAGYGCKWLNMAVNGWNGRKWL